MFTGLMVLMAQETMLYCSQPIRKGRLLEVTVLIVLSMMVVVLVELCTSKGLSSSGPGMFLLQLAIL